MSKDDRQRVRQAVDADLGRLRRRADVADAAGATVEQQLRIAFTHMLRDFPRDIARLEAALGVEEIERGSFFLGGVIMTNLAMGTDLTTMIRQDPELRDLFREYMQKARQT